MISENEIDSQHNKAVSELENGALMMWLVQHKDLMDGIEDGVEYFKSKYGLTPNVCIIHPDDADINETAEIEVIKDLMVATAPWCLKGHCLIGIISSKDSVWGVSV